MNPILLKPNTDLGSQVIVHGRAVGNMNARVYHDYKPRAMAAVLESHARLAEQYQAIIVEGAGSPAEINLRAGDIANMGFAEAVDCPVLLIADINRGGVFAHLVGTLELLTPSEQTRVAGFIINRFRGDIGLLQPGLDWLEQRTGKPVLGVLPYLHGLHLEAEDSLTARGQDDGWKATDPRLRVIAPATPRLSNHTDCDALRLHPEVDFRFVESGEPIPGADLIILPGSKSVNADLGWLRAEGWEQAILRHLRYGGKLIGVCGGFQMLGRAIHDPLGLEGPPGSGPGLGLLDFETTLTADKRLVNVCGTLVLDGAKLKGYEIHAGRSTGPALDHPACHLEHGPDGALSGDGQILGTYVHGLFDEPDAQAALLRWAGWSQARAFDILTASDRGIDRLADAVEMELDMGLIMDLLRLATSVSQA